VIHQLPRSLPLLGSPRCAACGTKIALVRLGRADACHACGEPLRYDRVEWLTAALFLALALRDGPTLPVFAYSLYTAELIVLAVVDLRHRFVYAVVVYPAILSALVITPLATSVTVVDTLIGFGLGVGVFGAFYLLGRLMYRGGEPLGKGDIELGALMGAMVGFPRIVTALFLGSIVNAVFIAILLLLRRRGRRDFIPYGPGLCVGVFVTFFFPPS
jgi:leader peptidase (prepilin peptidase) / N-methyltransferase